MQGKTSIKYGSVIKQFTAYNINFTISTRLRMMCSSSKLRLHNTASIDVLFLPSVPPKVLSNTVLHLISEASVVHVHSIL
jgi:hypothetical protein